MKNSRVNEIDILRFMAALAVVIFHYAFRGYAADGMTAMPYPLLANYAKYGYLGVHLFFMISGFVILMTSSHGSIKSFVISRIVRLYPAFWVCCTITYLLIITIGAPRFAASFGQYLTNMTMMSGFLGVPSIDGVYWSLFVELRFYALVAVVLTLGQIKHAQIILSLWLVASAALEAYPIAKFRYLLIVDYSAYFISGAMYFLIWSQGLSKTRVIVIAGAWLLAIYQSVWSTPAFDAHFRTMISTNITTAVISIFFVFFALLSFRKTGVIGRRRWLVAGALTYPLYLLHQNVGFMIFNAVYPEFGAHFVMWGTLCAVLLASFAIYSLVEKNVAPPLKLGLQRFLESLPSENRRKK